MKYRILDSHNNLITSYEAADARDIRDVFEEQYITYDRRKHYRTEELPYIDRHSGEVIFVSEFVDRFIERFGDMNEGINTQDGWFSPKSVLEFLAEYADENACVV